MSLDELPLESAYAACERVARRHYENFPVASRLLPRRMRRHVAAVYAFARTADDIADAGAHSPADRHRRLDSWQMRLHACVAAGPAPPVADRCDAHNDALFAALGHTIRSCNLPLSLFDDLLSAFRQDITTTRYATWAALLEYCRRSANPVGRLVLRIAGHAEPELDRASDCVCSALQLVNFWQDLEGDWRRGRLYVPAEDRAACAAHEADLDRGLITPGWRRVLERMARRTEALFVDGRPVCDAVRWPLQLELRLTWLGGMRILDRLTRAGYDVFTARPALGAADLLPICWGVLTWTKHGGQVAGPRVGRSPE